MTKLRWIGLVVVLIGSGISILWGTALNFETPGGVTDLKSIYYPARCLLDTAIPTKTGRFCAPTRRTAERSPRRR